MSYSFRAGPGWSSILILLKICLQTCMTCIQLSSRTRMEFHPDPAQKLSTSLCGLYTAFKQDQEGVPSWSCSKVVYKPVWHIPYLSVQWINSWWWTDELSETCRVSCQNKFVKIVHVVGFITKKFLMQHGHTNVKLVMKHSVSGPVNWSSLSRVCRHTVPLATHYFRAHCLL
jgi:hypothetical protein